MAEEQVTTKAELLAQTERAWNALHAALARLTPEQLTSIRDAQGWTVKDHIAHLAVWERSMIFFLQGKPRHEGLGVAEATYARHDFDEINADIHAQHKEKPLDAVLAGFRDTHQRLLALIHPLSDADLHKPYRRYLPDEQGEGDGPPAINLLYGNMGSHFGEHLEWIEELVSKSS